MTANLKVVGLLIQAYDELCPDVESRNALKHAYAGMRREGEPWDKVAGMVAVAILDGLRGEGWKGGQS